MEALIWIKLILVFPAINKNEFSRINFIINSCGSRDKKEWNLWHILIECWTFAVIRKGFFKVNNLTDLFENVKIDDILSLLRETELYQKYDNLKLVNLVQINKILLIENSTYLNIRFEIFGWICMYI